MGWEEREKVVEKIQEKYIKWTLGLDWRTSGYRLRDKVKWDEDKLVHTRKRE